MTATDNFYPLPGKVAEKTSNIFRKVKEMNKQHKGKLFFDKDTFKQMMGIFPEIHIEHIEINQEFSGREGVVITTAFEGPNDFYYQTQPYTEGKPILWAVMEDFEYFMNVQAFLENIAVQYEMTFAELLAEWAKEGSHFGEYLIEKGIEIYCRRKMAKQVSE